MDELQADTAGQLRFLLIPPFVPSPVLEPENHRGWIRRDGFAVPGIDGRFCIFGKEDFYDITLETDRTLVQRPLDTIVSSPFSKCW